MIAPHMLAADHIRELTQHHHTITLIHRDDGSTDIHKVAEPPLLDQLTTAAGDSAVSDDTGSTGSFGSKPVAHLGAIDAIARIRDQAWAMCDDLGITRPRNIKHTLLALSAHIGDQPHRKVRSWWAAARLLTQHDAPPHKPHGVPCPTCWDTSTIRIRLGDELATCIECGDVWDRTGEQDHGSLDVLGQHVAWCAEHEVTKARHWLIDDAGYPTECVECLPFRQAWAEWKLANKESGNTTRTVSY